MTVDGTLIVQARRSGSLFAHHTEMVTIAPHHHPRIAKRVSHNFRCTLKTTVATVRAHGTHGAIVAHGLQRDLATATGRISRMAKNHSTLPQRLRIDRYFALSEVVLPNKCLG